MALNVSQTAFIGDTQPVKLWSSDHKPHGMIPPHIIAKAADYYREKGDIHIVENYEKHNENFQSMRHARTEHPNQHQGVLADGQVVTVYTARNTEQLRFKLMRDSDDHKSLDRTVNEAYVGAQATYQLLKDVYKTLSVDGHSYPLNNTVHYETDYCNAFWNGEEMVFGDGDRKIFDRFTVAIDVTGHEIGHGLTQDQAGKAISPDGKPTGIEYKGEAGGINEGLSDILGIQVKQKANNQTAAQSNWLIGEGLILGSKGHIYALRSMKKPGTGYVDHPRLDSDSQIGNYGDYKTAAAKGEVDPHDSSGIVNKAFYEVSTKLGGFTWKKAGQIFFKTLPDLKPDETFKGMAEKTIATAIKEFGHGSHEEAAVREGWKVVQVLL